MTLNALLRGVTLNALLDEHQRLLALLAPLAVEGETAEETLRRVLAEREMLREGDVSDREPSQRRATVRKRERAALVEDKIWVLDQRLQGVERLLHRLAEQVKKLVEERERTGR